MIKKIYAKLGTGMTLQSFRWLLTPRTYLLESQQQHTDSVPAVSPVAEARLFSVSDEDRFAVPPEELTVFCPSCDYHSANALVVGYNDPFYNVTCSQCGLDADRDTVHLSPSSLQPHQAQ